MISCLQSSGLNLTVTSLTTSKINVSFPKSTFADKNLMMDQLKKRTEIFKNEIRDIRRKSINDFRSNTKDKDEIRLFESQIQKNIENLTIDIDKELELNLKKISR